MRYHIRKIGKVIFTGLTLAYWFESMSVGLLPLLKYPGFKKKVSLETETSKTFVYTS